MTSKDCFSKRCSEIFGEIDTEINRLSSCSLLTLRSNDVVNFKDYRRKISESKINEVIEAAKELEMEVKDFVKRNSEEKSGD